MKYYHSKDLKASMIEAEALVTAALKEQGFGVLTQIDVTATLKEKIDVDFRPYKILGACNPNFAHLALLQEEKIGLMLPCNVILEGKGDHTTVSAISPMASMQAVENESLIDIAQEVENRLQLIIQNL